MSIKIAIVGTGLIGGSLGLALHGAPGVERIIGIDNDNESLQRALEIGAIDQIATLEEGIVQADIVFMQSFRIISVPY